MGHPLSRPQVDDTRHASTLSLLDLPAETILEVTSYLDVDDTKALRSTCRYMDTILLNTFAKQVFHCLHVLPITHALETLIQISKDERMGGYVKELHLYCSIYQGRENFPNTNNHPRGLCDDELPFANPTTAEQEATNEAVEFVRRGGGFEKQLITALEYLNITSVVIHWYGGVYASAEGLKLGRRQLSRQTGRDAFGTTARQRVCRAWEYQWPMDMATHMTSIVLSALEKIQSSIHSLTIPIIQVDKLKVSPTLGAKLIHLRDLTIRFGIDVRRIPISSTPDICLLINKLPHLETLHLSTFPHERLNPLSLPLNIFFPYLHPSQGLRFLQLHSVCDTTASLAPFLAALPRLESLAISFIVIRERNYEPWRNMFMALIPVMTRQTLKSLDMRIDQYDAFKLAARILHEEIYGEDEEEDEGDEVDTEDEEDEIHRRERQEREIRERIGRREMLEVLAKRMPHYHDTVFRTCRMFFM
jgi:hypothetical protein